MTVFPTQDSFVRGEISPRLHGRAGLELYRSALALCENFITLPHGGIRKRGGTYFADETKNSAPARPIEFVYSETQAYCLLFGNLNFRVYAYGGPVMNGPSVVEVVTPYVEADIADLQFTQSGDVLYVTHPNYQPRKITRLSNTNWQISVPEFYDGPFASQNADEAVKVYASASSGSVTLTADSPIFTADLAGKLFKIEVETYETWKPWEAGGYLLNDSVAGLFRRYEGNVYEAVAPVSGVVGKISMGGTPPVHLKGEEWDGSAESPEKYSGIAAAYDDNYGVKWAYRHSGFGIGLITAVNGLTATATVLTDFPAELVGSGNKSYRWSSGYFGGGAGGYPKSVAISDERLFLAQKYSVFGTKSFDFTTFRTGADDDDALAFQLAGTNEITWLADADGFLIVGTIGGVRTLSGGNNEPITPSKFKNRGSPTKRCSSIPPVKAGSAFVYVGYDRKSLVEMNFSLEKNGYSTTPLGLISEHIPKKGITSLCFQAESDPIFWMSLGTGELGGLTYEADQNVRGWHRHKIGGRFGNYDYGVVEYAVTTPSRVGGDDTWMVVKRTINGQTKRYLEVKQPEFEYGDVTDAFLVDCGLSYSGVPVSQVSVPHLEGEVLTALADGKVVKNIEVSSGIATLPFAASKIHIGLPYKAVAETLELDVGGRDGSVMGRRKRVNSVIFSVLETANIYVRSASRDFELEKAGRNTVAIDDGFVKLFTGNLDEVKLDDTWEGQGRIRIEAPDPVPCTIRAMITGFDSESS